MKKFQSAASKFLSPFALIAVILIVWQVVCAQGLVSELILPAPTQIVTAFSTNLNTILTNTGTTLLETLSGILISVALGYLSALLMNRSRLAFRTLGPIVYLTQTIPTICLAPLLVLWFGFDMTPKIMLVVVACYFPICINLLNGMNDVDEKYLVLKTTYQMSDLEYLVKVKLKGTLKNFFVGLEISISYAMVASVIAEWLGGSDGLGVYMMRIRKMYQYDTMFALIFWISALSLLMVFIVRLMERKVLQYEK
ncbi:MAG: ABC transporter permease [Candidatus Ancillula sp.]|jgi:ABC-type nitrate/sulfonate/bicarbonate transport system permease component|nr:ABC transporter permease [Candidatus Ancillula sp.]